MDESTGPIAEFARDLRALRSLAGNPSYRRLARTALFAPSVLSSAASGRRLPTLPVTLAFVVACGGDRAAWERRWRQVAADTGTVVEARDVPTGSVPGERTVDLGPHVPRTDAATRPAQLPMSPGVFVGRGSALAGAAQVVGEPGTRIPLLISGPIGVGKTALALRLADDVCDRFPDGQLYVDLGDCEPGDDTSHGIIGGLLRALGVSAGAVPEDPMHRTGLYRSLLAQRRLFLLLENVRDESQVRPLLVRTTHSQLVMTSRARLLGLDGTHRVDLSAFSRQESMTLIGRVVGMQRVRAEHEAVDGLAELCGDLPLAVNIVARRIAARPELSVAYTAEQMADRERLLDGLSVGDVNVRHRLAGACQRLDPGARQALHLLGRNGAGWTTPIGLAAVLGVTVDTADELLESLVDAGLLTRSNVGSRYGVSALVSAFAAELPGDATRVSITLLERRSGRMRRPVESAPSPGSDKPRLRYSSTPRS